MAYTLGSILVRAVMENITGLPEDRYVNDFAFEAGADIGETAMDEVLAEVDDFYRENVTPFNISVGAYMSRAINRSATHRLDVYRIQAGGLGSPIRSDPWLGPTDPGTANGMVTEACGVLSYHSDFAGAVEEAAGGTRPKARRRGRLFIGPLAAAAVDTGAPPYRLNAQFCSVMRGAAARLRDASGVNGIPWSVWSRADATLRPVTGGWTDDSPDTQRRRGVGASARVVWGS